MEKITNLEDILTSFGYSLTDRGEYWQTNALYRGGDNQTALQIYKDSGVWKDYVEETGFLPFEALVEKSRTLVDEETFKSIKQGTSLKDSIDKPAQKDFIVEEFFDEKILKTFLPHYSFYEKKGISKNLLVNLNSGLCTQGQMYQRFVFPIFNYYKKIIGFAGRDMSPNSSRPKWKHIGKKTKWIYPLYTDKEHPAFSKNKNLIIVESIGDLLSLREHSDHNCLVSFGLDMSPTLISSILSLDFNKLIIAFNNDSDSKENRGRNAAIKNYLKLLSFFDVDKIKICLPTKNDFGDMEKENFQRWENKLQKIENTNQTTSIMQECQKLISQGRISKQLQSNLKFIKND